MINNLGFLINNLGFSGAEGVFSTLVNNLSKRNPTLNIFVFLLDDHIKYKINKKIKLKIIGKNEGNIKNTISIYKQSKKLKNYINENEIRVVLSFLTRSNYVNLISKFLGAQHYTIINVRNNMSHTYLNNSFKGFLNRILIKFLFKHADKIISASLGVKDDLVNKFQLKESSIKNIYNPYDIQAIEVKSKEIIEDKWLDDPKIKVIISIGRLEEHKRIEDLINAFKICYQSNSNIRLIILGKGSNKLKLENLSQRIKLAPVIKFYGEVNNPFSYLARSEAFVLSSEREGFPNVLVEAMICYCPVISTNCPSGPKEILDDGLHGAIIKVGDVISLAEEIKNIVNKENDMSIIINARKRAESFSMSSIIPQYEKELKVE